MTSYSYLVSVVEVVQLLEDSLQLLSGSHSHLLLPPTSSSSSCLFLELIKQSNKERYAYERACQKKTIVANCEQQLYPSLLFCDVPTYGTEGQVKSILVAFATVTVAAFPSDLSTACICVRARLNVACPLHAWTF